MTTPKGTEPLKNQDQENEQVGDTKNIPHDPWDQNGFGIGREKIKKGEIQRSMTRERLPAPGNREDWARGTAAELTTGRRK